MRLSRKDPGTKFQKQVLAANIDYALIVQGLDADFNIMRMERYIVQIIACGIKPIALLNKADIVDNAEVYKQQVEKLQRDIGVYCCSTYTGFGIPELMNDVMETGKTYILVGSSGTGKSSLLNSVHELRSSEDWKQKRFHGKRKAHHDITRFVSASKRVLIIDTPGMREFGVTSDEGQSSNELFPVIAKIAEGCRYTDSYARRIEVGCAVLDSLNSGTLGTEIYESYLKLMKEQRRFGIKAEDKKRLNKQFGKMTKEAKNYRKKYKY